MTGHTLRGSAARTLVGTTLGFFVGFAAVSLFGPTAVLLKKSMGLSPVTAGLLVAAPSLTGSLLRVPFGAWVDTTGGRKPFIVLLALSALGLAGLLTLFLVHPAGLTSGDLPLLILCGALAGSGIAVFSVGIGQVSYWYRDARQGTALATYAGLGNVAPGLFALALPVIIASLSMTGAYAAWLLMLLVGIGLYAWLGAPAPFFQMWRQGSGLPRSRAMEIAQQHGQELFPSGGVREALLATARMSETWLLVALYFTSFGGFLALTAWLPTFWAEHFGVTITIAGALTMLYSVLASVIRVPGGVVSDRIGGERTALGSFAIMGVGALVMALGHSVAIAAAGSVLLAVGMGCANAAVFKMVPTHLAKAGGGAGAGWVGGIGAFGGFVLPPLLGVLVAWRGTGTGYALGCGVFVVLAGVAMVVTWMLSARGATAPSRARRLVVVCPLQSCPAEVWAQALSGEMAPLRLIRCSLLPGQEYELECGGACFEQVHAQLVPGH